MKSSKFTGGPDANVLRAFAGGPAAEACFQSGLAETTYIRKRKKNREHNEHALIEALRQMSRCLAVVTREP
jgi:hypothetical protein